MTMPQRYGQNATPSTLPPVVEVTVVNFNMPFFALVGFLIKLALAAVPASIILAIVWGVLFAVLGGGLGIFGLLASMLGQR